jgi:hypothetical protein
MKSFKTINKKMDKTSLQLVPVEITKRNMQELSDDGRKVLCLLIPYPESCWQSWDTPAQPEVVPKFDNSRLNMHQIADNIYRDFIFGKISVDSTE